MTRVAALALLGLAGCLAVPTPTGDGDAGGGGGGVDGGDVAPDGCTVLLDESFDDPDTADLTWQRYDEATASASYGRGALVLGAAGVTGGAFAYADARTRESVAGAETMVLVDADISVAGPSAGYHVTLVDGNGSNFELVVYQGALLVERFDATLDDDDNLCESSCPPFPGGAWTFALRDAGDRLEAGAAPRGEPLVWVSDGAPLDGALTISMHVYGEVTGDVVDVKVQRVRWLDCAGAP